MVEAWRQVFTDVPEVSHGHVVTHKVRDGVTGEVHEIPLVDDGAKREAMDRVLKIQERRARYLGLEAPMRLELLAPAVLDAEIERLQAEVTAHENQRELQALRAAAAENSGVIDGPRPTATGTRSTNPTTTAKSRPHGDPARTFPRAYGGGLVRIAGLDFGCLPLWPARLAGFDRGASSLGGCPLD